MLTVDTLENLCGFEFDSTDTARANAIIELLLVAAEGITGQPIGENPHPLVEAAVLSAALRQMQNRSGALQESIGSYQAQYPMPGRLFISEELAMLKSAAGNTVTTVRIRTEAGTQIQDIPEV
jgi:hypothetical protein